MYHTFRQLGGVILLIVPLQNCSCANGNIPTQPTVSTGTPTPHSTPSTIPPEVTQPTSQALSLYNDPAIKTFFDETVSKLNQGNTDAINDKNPSDHQATVLEYAVETDNYKLVESLLGYNPNLGQPNDFGTLLHMAINFCRVDCIRLLLAQSHVGSFINKTDKKGRTPLQLAKHMLAITTHPRKVPLWRFIIQQLQAKGGIE